MEKRKTKNEFLIKQSSTMDTENILQMANLVRSFYF